MSWGSAVDIWNLGALVSGAWSVSPIVHFSDKSQVWDLFERQHLFGDIFDQNGNHDPFKHLALMVALIGPPQADFVQRSETTGQCFDYNGDWIARKDAVVPPASLEILEERLRGSEKEYFLHFLRSMPNWVPEERRSARQLFQDPWLL